MVRSWLNRALVHLCFPWGPCMAFHRSPTSPFLLVRCILKVQGKLQSGRDNFRDLWGAQVDRHSIAPRGVNHIVNHPDSHLDILEPFFPCLPSFGCCLVNLRWNFVRIQMSFLCIDKMFATIPCAMIQQEVYLLNDMIQCFTSLLLFIGRSISDKWSFSVGSAGAFWKATSPWAKSEKRPLFWRSCTQRNT